MTGDSASRALGIAAAVLSGVIVVGVLTFAGPCVHDDGSVSVCHSAQIALIAAGALALVDALASLFAASRKIKGALLLAAAACGAFIALSPDNLFALCMMSTMRCHAVMQPFAQFMGIALAALSVIGALRALRAAGEGR